MKIVPKIVPKIVEHCQAVLGTDFAFPSAPEHVHAYSVTPVTH
jgi:hypothetical protein